MGRNKDCFGDEVYVCRTRDCPYVADCVLTVWEKKRERAIKERFRARRVAGFPRRDRPR